MSVTRARRFNPDPDGILRAQAQSVPCDATCVKQLVQLARRMAHGIEVRDRVHHLHTYEACFVGSEAAEWMLRAGEAETMEAAVALGNKMLKEEVVYHVLRQHGFENAHLFYR
eukprot:1175860-Prorocentrum_minimum.AAC.1